VNPSFMATQLEEVDQGDSAYPNTVEHIQGASAMLYAAGTETVGCVPKVWRGFTLIVAYRCIQRY
jgi:hypothetical protein